MQNIGKRKYDEQMISLKDRLYRWDISLPEYLDGMLNIMKEYSDYRLKELHDNGVIMRVPDIADEKLLLLASKNPKIIDLIDRFDCELID